MIYLDSGNIQIRYADGKVDNQHWKAGDVAWSPANGMHTQPEYFRDSGAHRRN